MICEGCKLKNDHATANRGDKYVCYDCRDTTRDIVPPTVRSIIISEGKQVDPRSIAEYFNRLVAGLGDSFFITWDENGLRSKADD